MAWEYKTIKRRCKGFGGGRLNEVEFESRLNDLGEQGWELVTAFGCNEGMGNTRDVVAVFKRPK